MRGKSDIDHRLERHGHRPRAPKREAPSLATKTQRPYILTKSGVTAAGRHRPTRLGSTDCAKSESMEPRWPFEQRVTTTRIERYCRPCSNTQNPGTTLAYRSTCIRTPVALQTRLSVQAMTAACAPMLSGSRRHRGQDGRRRRRPIVLTYHAAELKANEMCPDPRTIREELGVRSARYFRLAGST